MHFCCIKIHSSTCAIFKQYFFYTFCYWRIINEITVLYWLNKQATNCTIVGGFHTFSFILFSRDNKMTINFATILRPRVSEMPYLQGIEGIVVYSISFTLILHSVIWYIICTISAYLLIHFSFCPYRSKPGVPKLYPGWLITDVFLSIS